MFPTLKPCVFYEQELFIATDSNGEASETCLSGSYETTKGMTTLLRDFFKCIDLHFVSFFDEEKCSNLFGIFDNLCHFKLPSLEADVSGPGNTRNIEIYLEVIRT